MMKYKALMLDVDGTLIPYDYNALPSQKVVDAVKKASEKVAVCIVTGRVYGVITHILSHLGLDKGYAIVNNGANVVDIKTQKLLYDQPIEKEDAEFIRQAFKQENIPFHIKPTYALSTYGKAPHDFNTPIEKTYMFFVAESISEKKVDRLFNKISSLSRITAYKTFHNIAGQVGINITHANATKLHGVEVAIKNMGVKKEEIIGVGDSYNDFPLLMASGLKVAMGNARDDLKAIADYVAPSVDDDGVADVIEKFIL